MRVDAKDFYADLFSKPALADLVRHEPPPLKTRPGIEPGNQIKALPAPKPEPSAVKTPSKAAAARSPLRQLIGDVDMHRLSPRQMANLSSDLYAAGVVSFDDYAALAFQPELHPDFARTIGALTGERAEPDRPRDFVRLWEERAEFQRRHNAARADLVKQDERIAAVLRQIDAPTNVVV
ncbi:MAG: hypothetical protein HYW28_03635 [Rhodospirillales bacterium]|nr:hypothetical protein [Rhodospirillales bacterium]